MTDLQQDPEWVDLMLSLCAQREVEAPAPEPVFKQRQVWKSRTCDRQCLIVRVCADVVVVRYGDEDTYHTRTQEEMLRLYFLLHE